MTIRESILQLNGRELLNHAGSISHQKALEKSSEEYKKYTETKRKLEKEMSLKELENDINQLKGKKQQ